MGINYKVIREGKDFYIKEVQTDEVILILNDMKSAQETARKLNMGAGFDGFTPKFILKE
jgi:hypothetical protein